MAMFVTALIANTFAATIRTASIRQVENFCTASSPVALMPVAPIFQPEPTGLCAYQPQTPVKHL